MPYYSDAMPHQANTIEELYQKHCNTFSDTQAHLGILRYLASKGKTVVELGTRTGVTTAALLASGAKVTSIDVERCDVHMKQLEWLCPGTFKFVLGNSLKAPIAESYDFTFFDSWHTYTHLKAEIERFAPITSQYMAFHDTKTFREHGEDGSRPGLFAAIEPFYSKGPSPAWKLRLDLDNCCGLMVLERQ